MKSQLEDDEKYDQLQQNSTQKGRSKDDERVFEIGQARNTEEIKNLINKDIEVK